MNPGLPKTRYASLRSGIVVVIRGCGRVSRRLRRIRLELQPGFDPLQRDRANPRHFAQVFRPGIGTVRDNPLSQFGADAGQLLEFRRRGGVGIDYGCGRG